MYKLLFFIGVAIILLALYALAFWRATLTNQDFQTGWYVGTSFWLLVGVLVVTLTRKKAFPPRKLYL